MPATTRAVTNPQKSVSVSPTFGVAGQALALRIRVELACAHGEARVREQLGVGQRGLDDEAGRGAEARIARREGELVAQDVVDHGRVTGRDDEALGGVVDEDALERGEDDRVADLDRVEVVEGVAVRGAVAGDGGVAGLARQGRPGVVPRPLAEIGRVRALHHDLVEADHRDPDVPDRAALSRWGRGWRRHGRSGRQLVERGLLREGVPDGVAVGLLLELGAQPGLGAGLLHRGTPDLVRGEQEQQDTEPDEDPPEDVDHPPERRHQWQRLERSEARIRSPCPQAWTVTRVPSGVKGNTVWALAIGISTHPSLWGKP